MKTNLLAAATLAGVLAVAPPSFADVIYDSGLVLGVDGLGAVNTVLIMHATGQSTDETGCTEWNGAATVGGTAACAILGGPSFGAETMTGGGQIGSPTLLGLGISDASALVMIFSPSEPASNSITLEQLALKIFRTDGALYFSATLPASVFFPSTDPGEGNAGFAFVLDPAQAAAWNGLGLLGTDRVGLEANADGYAGGQETFFVTTNPNFASEPPSTPSAAVPEPLTLTLLGTGFSALAFRLRRKKS